MIEFPWMIEKGVYQHFAEIECYMMLLEDVGEEEGKVRTYQNVHLADNSVIL